MHLLYFVGYFLLVAENGRMAGRQRIFYSSSGILQ